MFECVIIGVCDNGMWDSFALLFVLFFEYVFTCVFLVFYFILLFLFHFLWKCATGTPNAGRREY